jgi:glucosamine--fructose-6-phosphate aminotransferase (isomerizing)
MLKELRFRGKKLIITGIINVVDSIIAKEVDCGTYLNCGREFAVASTKSFTAQIVVLSLIAIWFAQYRNLYISERSLIISKLFNLQNNINLIIEENKLKCKKIAEYLINYNSCFILGIGSFEAIAKEGALLIKEIGYIHAESFNSTSLKYGPYALIHRGFPIILLYPDNENFTKNHIIYDELKSREAYIIAITDINLKGFDELINVENNNENKKYNEILFIIMLQLIAYYIGIIKKNNIDYPRFITTN